MLTVEEITFPRKEHHLVIPNGQLENIHKSNIIQTKQVVFMYAEGVCVLLERTYIHMHLYILVYNKINEKRDHEFKRKQGERKGEMTQLYYNLKRNYLKRNKSNINIDYGGSCCNLRRWKGKKKDLRPASTT